MANLGFTKFQFARQCSGSSIDLLLDAIKKFFISSEKSDLSILHFHPFACNISVSAPFFFFFYCMSRSNSCECIRSINVLAILVALIVSHWSHVVFLIHFPVSLNKKKRVNTDKEKLLMR